MNENYVKHVIHERRENYENNATLFYLNHLVYSYKGLYLVKYLNL